MGPVVGVVATVILLALIADLIAVVVVDLWRRDRPIDGIDRDSQTEWAERQRAMQRIHQRRQPSAHTTRRHHR